MLPANNPKPLKISRRKEKTKSKTPNACENIKQVKQQALAFYLAAELHICFLGFPTSENRSSRNTVDSQCKCSHT